MLAALSALIRRISQTSAASASEQYWTSIARGL
jgi:hypothetical protein